MDKELARRALQISYDHKLSHIGSVLTALPIIDEIYGKRLPTDRFILSSGHAGLAQYVCTEKYYGIDAEETLQVHGIHPVRDPQRMIDVSTGSLGQGISISLGIALADRARDVWCVLSDGECAEGVVWESLRIKRQLALDNLYVDVNANGYGAYGVVDVDDLEKRLHAFDPSVRVHRTELPDVDFLKGLKAHYHVMSEQDYCEILKKYEDN